MFLYVMLFIFLAKLIATYDHGSLPYLRYPTAASFVLVLLIALYAQLRVAPYAYRLQNYLEAFLMMYGARRSHSAGLAAAFSAIRR